jgi:hypothetical protein
MPVSRTWPGETREMRLLSKLIKLSDAVPDESLPEFIARRRSPGTQWRKWPELGYEIADVSDEVIADQSLRQWAKRYGIPEDTTADARTGPSAKVYAKAIERAGIIIS